MLMNADAMCGIRAICRWSSCVSHHAAAAATAHMAHTVLNLSLMLSPPSSLFTPVKTASSSSISVPQAVTSTPASGTGRQQPLQHRPQGAVFNPSLAAASVPVPGIGLAGITAVPHMLPLLVDILHQAHSASPLPSTTPSRLSAAASTHVTGLATANLFGARYAAVTVAAEQAMASGSAMSSPIQLQLLSSCCLSVVNSLRRLQLAGAPPQGSQDAQFCSEDDNICPPILDSLQQAALVMYLQAQQIACSASSSTAQSQQQPAPSQDGFSHALEQICRECLSSGVVAPAMTAGDSGNGLAARTHGRAPAAAGSSDNKWQGWMSVTLATTAMQWSGAMDAMRVLRAFNDLHNTRASSASSGQYAAYRLVATSIAHTLEGNTALAVDLLKNSLPTLSQDNTRPWSAPAPTLTSCLPVWRQLLHILTATAAAAPQHDRSRHCTSQSSAGLADSELLQAITALLLHTRIEHKGSEEASCVGSHRAPASSQPGSQTSHAPLHRGLRHLAAPCISAASTVAATQLRQPHIDAPDAASAADSTAATSSVLLPAPTLSKSQVISGYATDLALGLDSASQLSPGTLKRARSSEETPEAGPSATGEAGRGTKLRSHKQEHVLASSVGVRGALLETFHAASHAITPPSRIPAGPTIALIQELLPGLPDMMVGSRIVFVAGMLWVCLCFLAVTFVP